MYKITHQDQINFIGEFTDFPYASKPVETIQFLIQHGEKLEPLIIFHKMAYAKVKLDSLEKYGSTEFECSCVYHKVSSLSQFGFPVCKHNLNVWICENPEKPIGKYLEELGGYFNQNNLHDYLQNVLKLLHVIYQLEAEKIIKGFCHQNQADFYHNEVI